MAEAIAILKQQGAIIVDPADIPSVVDQDASRTSCAGTVCSGADGAKGNDAECSVVFKYGMKRDFNTWLASLGPGAPVKITDRAARAGTSRIGMPAPLKYGQSQLDISDEMDVEADRARYEADRAKDLLLVRRAWHRRSHAVGTARCHSVSRAQTGAADRRRGRAIPPSSFLSEWCRMRRRPPIPGEFGAEACALRRELRRDRLQRAAPDRARLRVRTGDKTARSTCLIPVTAWRT